ncbi:ROK family protein [Devosia nitrariae]|nr:ROK family protein [Devosia nitrariae]
MYVTALNTNDARNRNLAAVFDAIRDRAGASRKEIGLDMPFSLQTMTNVVQELIGIGLVEEVERTGARIRGNPHRGLKVVADRGYALGIQFRWNACLSVLVDLDYKVRDIRTTPIDVPQSDIDGYLARLEAVILGLIESYAGKDIWTVGVSGPLPIEVPNMPSHTLSLPRLWTDQRWFQSFAASVGTATLRTRLERTTGLPVRLLNNSQAAALAQSMILPAEARFVYVLAGLGLGASYVCGRALSQDVWKHGGEIGHVIYRGRTLSSVMSASGLRESIKLDLPQGEMEATLEHLAAHNQAVFEPWLDETAPILRFLVNFVEAAMWPDGIAMGGFMPTVLIDQLIARAYPLSDSVVPPDGDPRRLMPRLFRAKRGAEAIPLGAAVSTLSHSANPELPNLIARRRVA